MATVDGCDRPWAACAPRVSACGAFFMSMRISTAAKEPSRRAPDRHRSGTEDKAMTAAIRLARRGVGTTHPNPRVGAVVLRGGAIVGRGFHARAGEAHAEVRALEEAGDRARGQTLVSALRAAGIEVVEDVRREESLELNPAYLNYQATGLPWVMLKSMISLDGRVASDAGESRGLGGDEEQRLSHRLRAEHDAILVGIGTVLQDDPELTVRLWKGRNPLRVVLDSRLRIPAGSRLVRSAHEAPLLIATVSQERPAIQALEAVGVRVSAFAPDEAGQVPLQALFRKLAKEGRLSLLVEGGPTVHTAVLREGLANRVAVGIAPRILGGASTLAWTRDLGRAHLDEAIEVESLVTRRVGRDLWIEGAVRKERDV